MQHIQKGIKDFNLDHIFDCGQCFRWEREADGSYTGIALGTAVNMRLEESEDATGNVPDNAPVTATGNASEKEKTLIIDNCSREDFEDKWRTYLDLDRDYGAIKRSFSGEEIGRASAYGYGIRILKQEFWESLLSFIISQNNNIPRIKGCVENLASNFGEKIGEYRGKMFFSLPDPECLAALEPEELAVCKLGYRAPYLVKTARKIIDEGGPKSVEEKLKACENFEEACAKLREYPGVGPKVASCVALFGLGFLDAFPIDVWMRRVMHRLYGIDEKDVRSMSEYAKANFGCYGGIAQQYLFYYIRGLEQSAAE